jgi:hypothetical protein
MKRKKSWSDEDLKVAIQSTNTLAGVLRKLGLSTSPGNYRQLHLSIKRLSLNISHLKGKAHGTSFGTKRPLEDILIKNSDYSATSHLRKRLFKEGLLNNKCSLCGNEGLWNDKQLTLQLDHINGDCCDNRLENLRILCPNCHSQTPTFKGHSLLGRYNKEPKKCSCGAVIHKTSDMCVSCYGRNIESKINWPQLDVLVDSVIKTNYVKVGKDLGVSDNAVRKYIKRRLGYFPRKHKLSNLPAELPLHNDLNPIL